MKEKNIKKENTKKEKEILRMNELKNFDKTFMEKYPVLAGIDEAGRGPLAGPVVVAAVIFEKDTKILGIDDSKKLSEKKREKIYDEIIKKALAYKIVEISEKEIDEKNILNATKIGVKKAIENLEITPDVVILDALKDIDTKIPYISVVKGDSKSYAVAAASILAKVYRDRKMKEISKKYPSYGFEKHKGYGTKMHYEALKKYGISEVHRKSFVHLDENGNRVKVKK